MARMLSLDKTTLKKPGPGSEMGTGSVAGNGDDDLGMQQSNWRLLGLSFFFLFYLAMGASVFSAIEGPIESEAVKSLEEKQSAFLKKFPCIEAHDLEELMSDVVDANNRGVSLGWNGSVSVPSWSFGQSFFFSSTVITTIGYGHQSPLSSEGKVFCIIYALIGIPMTLILFSAVLERLQIPVQFLLDLMKSKIGHLYQPIYVYLIHFTFIVCLVIFLMFLLPAAVFTTLESNWNYLDSLYYCFISLTTIGLGDFIPGDSPGQALRPVYKACTTFYLLAGVVSMMLLLTIFYNIPQCNFKLFFLLRPGGCCSSNNGRGPGQNGGERVDPERIRLQSSSSGPKYTQHLEDPEGNSRRTRVIRAKSRPCEDSPSPTEEEPSSFSGQN
ncbi:hypothetical protein TCAL_09780 [Tigriopus californicus]|uniref:Potassium channel domain-containing protein n=1 Tax=Tigriopus californicus TaxID=6832 RepID=A0A553PKB0_TIGCA|nr:potassium channel subfamily K member 6-like [Tigriopus californicus]TRY78120.1 hypothetical protein TCAL_09780 [Tigriopus californicus]